MKKQNNIYRTVKIDERYCGIGLFNIRKIVEKYNGEFSVSHSDNVLVFRLCCHYSGGKNKDCRFNGSPYFFIKMQAFN